jgi:hypothetical protein
MNKLFIGLLLAAAAGTAVYFFVFKKKNSPQLTSSINKDEITGKWKLHSFEPGSDTETAAGYAVIGTLDTNFKHYTYSFEKESRILILQNDTTAVDTAAYEWKENKQLVFKKAATDSAGEVFSVLKLNRDSLKLLGNNSLKILYTKAK